MRVLRRFRDIHELGEPFCFVHPYKQKAVKYLVDRLPDSVSYAFVFGSAIQSGHFWWHDLDVCLVAGNLPDNFASPLKLKPREHSYDFVVYPSMEALRLEYDDYTSVGYHVLREGLLVYERK